MRGATFFFAAGVDRPAAGGVFLRRPQAGPPHSRRARRRTRRSIGIVSRRVNVFC